MPNQSLILAVDLYGCPNRCRHCWLGHAPNRPVNEEEDIRIVDYFRPFFPRITFYSWLREPDYCGHYRERWLRTTGFPSARSRSGLSWQVSGGLFGIRIMCVF